MKSETIYISSKSHLNLTFNLLQCGVNEIPVDGKIAVKDSDSFMLVYINEGVGLLETGHFASKINAAQGFFVFPDTSYSLQNVGTGVILLVLISFTGYLVENYLNRANIKRTSPVFDDPKGDLGEKINRIYAVSRKLPNRYCRMMSGFYDIFSCLLDANPTRSTEGSVDNDYFYAVKATDYIEQSYGKNLTVEEIAARLGISRRHLYAVFNGVLKISPKQYLIYYRIEKACLRLKSSDQPIREIAGSVGYLNQFYFAKEFKRLTGRTPSEYRKDPKWCEIFSYRSFIATLRERIVDTFPARPVEEQIVSVYTPPQTVLPEEGKDRRGDKR